MSIDPIKVASKHEPSVADSEAALLVLGREGLAGGALHKPVDQYL